MGIHFTKEEFAERKSRAVKELKKQKLDALLMFRQESMYWLTGYDTFGFVFFQCLILTIKGDLVFHKKKMYMIEIATRLSSGFYSSITIPFCSGELTSLRVSLTVILFILKFPELCCGNFIFAPMVCPSVYE